MSTGHRSKRWSHPVLARQTELCSVKVTDLKIGTITRFCEFYFCLLCPTVIYVYFQIIIPKGIINCKVYAFLLLFFKFLAVGLHQDIRYDIFN